MQQIVLVVRLMIKFRELGYMSIALTIQRRKKIKAIKVSILPVSRIKTRLKIDSKSRDSAALKSINVKMPLNRAINKRI